MGYPMDRAEHDAEVDVLKARIVELERKVANPDRCHILGDITEGKTALCGFEKDDWTQDPDKMPAVTCRDCGDVLLERQRELLKAFCDTMSRLQIIDQVLGLETGRGAELLVPTVDVVADEPGESEYVESKALCPECQAGKPQNCNGDALDEATDQIVDCAGGDRC